MKIMILASLVLSLTSLTPAFADPKLACRVQVMNAKNTVQVGTDVYAQIAAVSQKPIVTLSVNDDAVVIDNETILFKLWRANIAAAGPFQVKVVVSDGVDSATCESVQLTAENPCKPSQTPIRQTIVSLVRVLEPVSKAVSADRFICKDSN